jgi:hypothetical protein
MMQKLLTLQVTFGYQNMVTHIRDSEQAVLWDRALAIRCHTVTRSHKPVYLYVSWQCLRVIIAKRMHHNMKTEWECGREKKGTEQREQERQKVEKKIWRKRKEREEAK